MGSEVINLDFDGPAESDQIVGYYFQSKRNISRRYLIQVIVEEIGTNVLVKIFEIEHCPQNIENGRQIAVFSSALFCEIDLRGKYYFPTFVKQQNQWYYDVTETSSFNWELNENGRENEIYGFADAMDFAVKQGLKDGEIKLH